jgi:hypothetical protein
MNADALIIRVIVFLIVTSTWLAMNFDFIDILASNKHQLYVSSQVTALKST